MTNQSRGELVPGGLAMIVGCTVSPVNIGRIVTTEKYMSYGDTGPAGIAYSGLGGWLCRADGLFLAYSSGRLEKSDHCFIDPKNLMPINPEADPLDITEQMECKA